ncbi:DUF4326 domain-containing protein, partial [Streptomyces roseoviridis]
GRYRPHRLPPPAPTRDRGTHPYHPHPARPRRHRPPRRRHRRTHRRLGLPQLVGKDLACACAPGELCHADVLLEWAAAPDLAARIAKARARVDQARVARGEDPLHGSKAAA